MGRQATFAFKASLRSQTPLAEDQMRQAGPSIFAQGKHASRSERYDVQSCTGLALGSDRKVGLPEYSTAAIAPGLTR